MPGGLGGTAINRNNKRKSASLAAYEPKIADNIKTRNVLLEAFMPLKKIKEGGTEVAVKFRYKKKGKLGENLHNGAFNYYDQLNTAPSDTIKTGAESWCNLHEPITISHEEQDENSGKYAEFDLVKDATTEAMDSMAENINDVLWGVAGGDQDKLATPITSIVSGSDDGTIHGLSKASNTWLYSQESTSIGDAATELLPKIVSAFNLTADNAPNKGDKLGLLVTDRQVYEVLQNFLPAYIEYGNNKNVDIGIEKVVYMGTKIAFDSTCPTAADGTHYMYGLMLKYWQLAIRKQKNFKVTEFYDMLPDQAADVAQLFFSFAVVFKQPRTNWRGSGITIS
jgi:hypothetical protein